MDNPKLYGQQKFSLNQIRKKLNLDKMYLYRFVGNYEKIEKMPYNIVLGIAKVEGLEPNDLYNRMLVYAIRHPRTGD